MLQRPRPVDGPWLTLPSLLAHSANIPWSLFCARACAGWGLGPGVVSDLHTALCRSGRSETLLQGRVRQWQERGVVGV